MAAIIKPKRSESTGALPTTETLEVGEIAMNVSDGLIYTRNSSNFIVPVSNYVDIDPTEVDSRLDAIEAILGTVQFPTGDYGNLDTLSVDAFGISVSPSYDCLTTPIGALSQYDLGVLS
jgi:hypothetical protein